MELYAESPATGNTNLVKAGYLRNFARYVTWPTNSFGNDHSSWRVGVLGDEEFARVLNTSLAGRTEHGRAFEIISAGNLSALTSCQIIFVVEPDSAKRRDVLQQLKDKPVLTVSDAPDFLGESGIIRFVTSDRIQMSINLDQARAVSLKIPSQMLEVSREVLENGAIRKLR